MLLAPGMTSISIDFLWLDDSGFPVTGKVAADLPIIKWSSGTNTADTIITPSDLSAITDVHSSGGFKEREGGWYRLDLPDDVATLVGSKKIIFIEETDKRFIIESIEVRTEWKSEILPNSTKTYEQAMEFIVCAVGAGKTSGVTPSGNQNWVLRNLDDSDDLATIANDGIGNRSDIDW